jgi:hypothetical protein
MNSPKGAEHKLKLSLSFKGLALLAGRVNLRLLLQIETNAGPVNRRAQTKVTEAGVQLSPLPPNFVAA